MEQFQLNPHPDLPLDVRSGLAWYYWLAALANAIAAAYLAYGSMVMEGASREGLAAQTRRMPKWLLQSVGLFFVLAVAVLTLRMAFGESSTVIAYYLCAIGTAILAIQSAADAISHGESHDHSTATGNGHALSLDDHIPAVGIGSSMNRARWAIIWAVAAVIFQVMGIVYVHQMPVAFPSVIKDAIDWVSGPTTFFVGATIAFAALIRYRKIFVNGIFAWCLVNVGLLYFGLSLTDFDFRDIVVKPDNVPITGMMVLVGYFTWLSLRRAVINDARMARGLPNLEELEPDKTLTWPDLVYTELIAMVVGTIILIVWSIALQAPLEQPASSTVAPNPAKAPWYFLGLQEMLVYFDPWMAGVWLPTLIIIGLMAIPYIDTNKSGNGYYTYEQRKFAYITFQYGFLVLWVVLILLGTFLRGPNWNFFGPYEYWSHSKLIPLNNVNLSDIFWVDLLGTMKPQNMLIREAPGIGLVLAYMVITPLLLVPFFKKYIKEAGWVRYGMLSFLLLFLASLPIKMVLRWTLNLKYLVYMREIFFNI